MRERVRQFREASLGPSASDLELARTYLSEPLLDLFRAQEPRDQRHAAETARWLLERRHDDDDLIVAALLHDVGKGEQRTRDRVAHVVATWLGAGRVLAAQDSSVAVRRAVARSRRHSALGAELLTRAGASPRAITLTRLHHRAPGADGMLALLQRADAAN